MTAIWIAAAAWAVVLVVALVTMAKWYTYSRRRTPPKRLPEVDVSNCRLKHAFPWDRLSQGEKK